MRWPRGRVCYQSRWCGEYILSQSDPTDSALAAIASILEQPSTLRESPPAEASHTTETADEAQTVHATIVEEKPLAPEPPIEADGYSKLGPGPMAAIRFRWTARRNDDGLYYVDETIGDNAAPITAGPMSRDAAVRMVDEREAEARLRFEQLKSEMTGRSAAASLVRGDSSDI